MGVALAHTLKILQVFPHVFSKRGYLLFALAATAVFTALPILVPVWFVPSSTIPLVLALMRPINYVLLALLAAASGVLISLNVFLLRQRQLGIGTAGETGISSITSLFAGVGACSCGCGIGFVFGFLGLGIGGATFLIVNQVPIMLAALVVVLVSLYLAARKATNVNGTCTIVSDSM